MKKCLLILFTLFVVQNLFSQNKVKQDSIFRVTKNSPIIFSYYGDYFGVKPGIRLGVDRSFYDFKIQKTKKSGKVKIKTHDLFTSYNLVCYRHKGYNTAIYLFPEIGYRYISNSGFFCELRVGAGLFRTFLDGPTYTVDAEGNIQKIPMAGAWYGAFNASPAIGWDFSAKNPNSKLQIFLRPAAIRQFPYNSHILYHLTTEIGVSYAIPNFITNNTKVKLRVKSL